jgi:hypothetical protein
VCIESKDPGQELEFIAILCKRCNEEKAGQLAEWSKKYEQHGKELYRTTWSGSKKIEAK